MKTRLQKNRICKKCKQTFQETEKHKHTCPTCFAKTKQQNTLNYFKNGGTTKNTKWQNRKTKATILKTATTYWNYETLIPHTNQKCAYCQELHWKDKRYKHPYCKQEHKNAILTEHLKELLTDYTNSKLKPEEWLKKEKLTEEEKA